MRSQKPAPIKFRARAGWPMTDRRMAISRLWILFKWGPPEDPQRYVVQGYYTDEQGDTVGCWRDTA